MATFRKDKDGVMHIQLSPDEMRRLPNSPIDNIRVNRYMNMVKFRSLVKEKYVWFNRLDNYSDEHEGRAIIDWQSDNENQNWWRKSTVASCWNWDVFENFALWNIYLGGDNEGVCVVSSRDDFLVSVVDEELKIEDYFVEYVPYGEFYSGINYSICATRKYIFYKYENEFRFLIYVGKDFEEYGLRVKIRPEQLIKGVILSPDVSDEIRHEVISLVEEIGLESDIVSDSIIMDKLGK